MISTILIDGQPTDGRVPVTDSSVLRGDGCFEVLKAYDGKPFGLEEHLDRLEASASALEIPLPERSDMASWIQTVASELGSCAVRVVVTRGGSVPGVDDPSRVIVFAHTWNLEDAPARLLPVAAPWHAVGEDWALAGAKVISYAPNLSASRQAQNEGFTDALLMASDGRILEGPTFSIAWVVGDRLETPTLELGILDSITRRLVLNVARELGVEVVEGVWGLDRLEEASEVMALSTVREVQPVTAVKPLVFEEGSLTEKLGAAFLRLVEEG